MGKVSGPLKTVLSNPSSVTGAWIRSMGDRPDGDGMILDEQDRVILTDGVLSFTARPGPAVLVLEQVGERPKSLKLIVGKEDSSLADAVKAASVANHLDSYRLAQLVGMIEATQQNATDAQADAERAEAARNQAESMVATKIAGMSPMVWVFHGTGAPTLTNFPGARVGDVVRRMSDGQEWRVDP